MEDLDLEVIMEICKVPMEIANFTPSIEVQFHMKGKHPQRNIFKSQTFNDRELEKLKRLKIEIQKNKVKVPARWDDSDLLKFVYGANFKTRGALKALKSCLASYSEVFPQDYLLIYPKILEILKTGPLYMHGRDRNFRPLMIMNFVKFDLKKYSIEQYMQSACFLLQFAADHMLFPGKVENWMCISDIGFRGLSDLPLNTLRKITQVLQDVFKCRLAYSAMINVPKSIYFIYSFLKPFLDPVTIDKISISKENIAVNIISHFNPYQVEERYGGKAPNLTVFWPPVFPNCPLDTNSPPIVSTIEDIITSPAEISLDLNREEEEEEEKIEEDDYENEAELVKALKKQEKRKERKRQRRSERKKLRKLREKELEEEKLEQLEIEYNRTNEVPFEPNPVVFEEVKRVSESYLDENLPDLVLENTQVRTTCNLVESPKCALL